MTSSLHKMPEQTPVAHRAGLRSWLKIVTELGKARLSLLVVVTAIAGFVLASSGAPDWPRLWWTAMGTLLAAMGINAFNQWMERGRDGLMRRTCNRPLPSRRIEPRKALVLAIVLSLAGDSLLWMLANPLTAVLSLICQFIYIAVYTPLKTRDPICTIAGAVCGAIPPLMGWAAATGSLGLGGWLLAALLFIWQVPHFLALAWMYREDYKRGGFMMLPNVEESGELTFKMLLLYSTALLPLGVCMALLGLTGWLAAWGSLALGASVLALGWRFASAPTYLSARRVFLASVAYLPLILGVMIADRTPMRDGALAQPVMAVSVAEAGQGALDPAGELDAAGRAD